MKIIMFVLVMLGGVNDLLAQNHYYYKGEKIPLLNSTKMILVKFYDEVSIDSKIKATEFSSALKPIREENVISGNMVIIDIVKSVSENELAAIIERISLDENVKVVNSFFEYEKDNVLLGISDVFFVKLKRPTDYSEMEKLALEMKTRIIEQFSHDKSIYLLSADKNSRGNAIEMANYFSEANFSEFSEPNFFSLFKKSCVNDPGFTSQWGLKNTGQSGGSVGNDINVCAAWEITTGSDAISIAVLDEGVDLNHPDLVGNLLPGYDATGAGSQGDMQNNDAHGTNCAGIIAATGNNGVGMSGIAYGSKIIPVRIATQGANGHWITSNLWQADGMYEALNQGADIFSCSYGGGAPNSMEGNAIDYAVNSGRNGLGCPVIYSAGNNEGKSNSISSVSWPAYKSNVIAVGAMSMCAERKTRQSCDGEDWAGNFGDALDVSAPGVNIYSTDIHGSAGYDPTDYNANFNGTSAACPHVAGVMALILSVNRCLSQNEARQILELSCDKVGVDCYSNVNGHPNGAWNNQLGYGSVNAFKAVQYANSLQTNLFFDVSGVDQGSTGDFSWVLQGSGCSQLAGGYYVVKRHEVKKTVSYPNTQSPVLVGGANGFSLASPNSGNYYMDIVSVSNTSATVRTWVYEVISTSSGQTASWLPSQPSDIRFSFSVLSEMESDIILQNQTVSTGYQSRNAMNQIEAGKNITNVVPVGDYIVEGTANITLHGGNKVILNEGSYIRPNSGGFFRAYVDPFFTCTQFPNGKKASDDNDYPDVINNFEVVKIEKNLGNSVIDDLGFSIRNYPNPFSEYTTLEYKINKIENITITIRDSGGRPLYKLKNKTPHDMGLYRIKLSGINLSAGIYYCTIQTESDIETIEIIVVK